MDKKLLRKYIDNNCTSAEVDEVFEWVQKQKDEYDGKVLLKDFWNEIDRTEAMDENFAQRRLDRIHHRINLSRQDKWLTGKFFFLPGKNRFFVTFLSKAAAILLISVMTLFIYTYFFQSDQNASQLAEIISPAGSRTSLELSDGTKVWLNQGSKMIYPQKFTGRTRTVRLSGEGYFDVAHDKTRPFIVESRGMEVRAVGTRFNVKAYMDDTDFETTLESGKIIILKKIPDKELTVCQMSPGQHFIINNKTNKYSLKTGELAKYVSWKEGKLVFKDDKMDKVAERLSRWYNVEIIIKDPEVRELTYTATFVDESLDQVLEMLEVITPISYTVSDREKMPDGTFSKKKILIYKKK